MGLLINKEAMVGSMIYMAGYTEPSLIFYSHLNPDKSFSILPQDDQQLSLIAANPKKLIFIVTEVEFKLVADLLKRREFSVVKKMNVINTNNDKRVREVYLIVCNSI